MSLAAVTRGDEPSDEQLGALRPALEITRVLDALRQPTAYYDNLQRIAWATARFYAGQLSYRMYQPDARIVQALRSGAPPVVVEDGEDRMEESEDEPAPRASKRRRGASAADITVSVSTQRIPREMTPPELVALLRSLPDDGTGWQQTLAGGIDAPEAQTVRNANLLAERLRAAGMELALLASERRGALAQARLAILRAVLEEALIMRS